MADLQILKGKTFQQVVRWDTTPLIYKAITGISKSSPVSITVPSHDVPDGWPVAVVSAGGMRKINARNWPLRSTDFHAATVSSSSVLLLNDVNSADWTAYTSGGSVVYYTPVDLANCTARMQIRSTPEATGTPLLSLVSPTDIALDNVAKTITIVISATVTAALSFHAGVYDLEVENSLTGVVTQLLSGAVTVVDEVTR